MFLNGELSDHTIPLFLLRPDEHQTRATATCQNVTPCMPPAMHLPALPAVYALRPPGRGGMGEALWIKHNRIWPGHMTDAPLHHRYKKPRQLQKSENKDAAGTAYAISRIHPLYDGYQEFNQ